MPSSTLARLTLAGILALALVPLGQRAAEACGGFFSMRVVSPEQRPSLSREKVLLIHDAQAGRQHFIREVAFERASEPFGFVVPTPTRPDVGSVASNPFTRLRDRFPFTKPRGMLIGYGGGHASLGGSGGRYQGVEVLEVEKIGSFTAFVIAATDVGGLTRWLADNDLVSTPETDLWLTNYVRAGFFYVALRYDPPKSGKRSGMIAAETIRISFATPVPYYPYFEPTTQLPERKRLMELWTIGSEAVVPVALRDAEGERRWLSPLRAGITSVDARKLSEAALSKELEVFLPQGEGELVVQTFQDQKLTRSGWGDILFAAKQPRTLSPRELADLRPLLAILDPELARAPTP